jgi:hypothetical protein
MRNVQMSAVYTASRKRAAAAMSGAEGDVADSGFVSQASQSLMFSQTQSQFDDAESMFTAPDATMGTLSTQVVCDSRLLFNLFIASFNREGS